MSTREEDSRVCEKVEETDGVGGGEGMHGWSEESSYNEEAWKGVPAHACLIRQGLLSKTTHALILTRIPILLQNYIHMY